MPVRATNVRLLQSISWYKERGYTRNQINEAIENRYTHVNPVAVARIITHVEQARRIAGVIQRANENEIVRITRLPTLVGSPQIVRATVMAMVGQSARSKSHPSKYINDLQDKQTKKRVIEQIIKNILSDLWKKYERRVRGGKETDDLVESLQFIALEGV